MDHSVETFYSVDGEQIAPGLVADFDKAVLPTGEIVQVDALRYRGVVLTGIKVKDKVYNWGDCYLLSRDFDDEEISRAMFRMLPYGEQEFINYKNRIEEMLHDEFELVSVVEITRIGWEMDNYVWVVKSSDGQTKLITTNHGTPYFTSREEVERMLNQMRDILTKSEAAFDAALKYL